MNRNDWEKELSEAPLGIGGFNERTMRKIKERVTVPVTRKSRFQPAFAGAMVVLLLVSGWWMRDSLSGWFTGKEGGEPARTDAWDQEDVVLKIQYYDQASFMNDFGLPFVVRHPNAQIEVPPSPESIEPENYKMWLQQYEPDLLQVPLFLVDSLEGGAYSAAGRLGQEGRLRAERFPRAGHPHDTGSRRRRSVRADAIFRNLCLVL